MNKTWRGSKVWVQIGIALLLLASTGSSPASQVPANDYVPPYYVEQVADIAAGVDGSDPSWFTNVNGTLYFQANDGANGAELWKYSPLTRETKLVSDINVGGVGSNPEWLTVYGNDIYFAATDAAHGRQLWRYDTAAETVKLVVDLGNYPVGSDPKWLQFVGPTLYFNARGGNGKELYAYDTRTGQARLVKDINPFGDSNPQYLFGQGATVYFTADDGVHGEEIWRSNGTSDGTSMIKDIYQGSNGSKPSSFNLLGYMFVFSANDGVHGRELWRSYGTAGTTKMVRDIAEGKKDSNPGWSNRLADSMIFFPAETETYGTELWRFDPQYGAYLLADINKGDKDSDPAAIGSIGWVMFFAAKDDKAGAELWKTEPRYTYAVRVSDINPGVEPSNPKSLERLGTTLFFTANDGVHGEEVWFSELPYATTHLLKDIRPGINGSVPTHVYGGFTGTLANAIRMGWTIYFTANDGSTGVELWQISTGLLPRTGFAPNTTTAVPPQPASLEYQSYQDLLLEIPKLGQRLLIVGIPKEGNSWKLDWLGANEVGYLMGTAFPTLPGNTAITGHVYLPDGSPGPFVDLRELAWDDEIVIHAWGQKYIYKVRYKNEWVDPNDASVLSHKEHDWVTLITCRGFDETSGYYRWRTVVQAILVEIKE